MRVKKRAAEKEERVIIRGGKGKSQPPFSGWQGRVHDQYWYGGLTVARTPHGRDSCVAGLPCGLLDRNQS